VTDDAARRSGRTWLPLAGAAATLALIIGIVLALPQTKQGTAQQFGETTLDMTTADDAVLNDHWVVVAGGKAGSLDARIEVRPRTDLSRVVATLPSTYAHGSPGCLALTGDWLLFTDFETVETGLVPGPPTRWSLWVRNLLTGEQHELEHGKPAEAGMDDSSCAVAGNGWAAWSHDGQVVLRELATGAETSYRDAARPVAFTPHGLVEQAVTGPGLASDMGAVLRSGSAFAERTVVTTVPLGTTLNAAGDTLVTIAAEAHAETSDGAVVSTCALPRCADLSRLQRDPGSSWPVVGDGFVAWTALADSPRVIRLDGKPAPELATGHSFFRTVKAWKGTLLYTTQAEVTKSAVVLHLVKVTG
jgi:hypothetical protein